MKSTIIINLLVFNNTFTKTLLNNSEHRTWVTPNAKFDPKVKIEHIIRQLQSSFFVHNIEDHIFTGISRDGEIIHLNFAIKSDQSPSTVTFDWIPLEEINKINIESKLVLKIKNAHSTFELIEAGKSLATSRLESALSNAIDFLRVNYVTDGELEGWPQFIGSNKKVGHIGTSLVSIALSKLDVLYSELNKSIHSLKLMQSEDGGWATTTSKATGSKGVTESTAMALTALISANEAPDSQSIVKAIDWLIKAQRADGGWGSGPGEKAYSRVYPTTLVIKALSSADKANHSITKATIWLRNKQNQDGGWGFTKSADNIVSSSDSVMTAHAIIALLISGVGQSDKVIRSGVNFLKNSWNPSEQFGWANSSEVVPLFEADQGAGRLEVRYFSAPWAIIALLKSGEKITEPKILFTTNKLLDAQHYDGYWEHEFCPGQKPVWATTDMILLISELLDPVNREIEELLNSSIYSKGQSDLIDFLSQLYEVEYVADIKSIRNYRRVALIAGISFAVVLLLLLLELTTGWVKNTLSLSSLAETLLWAVTSLLLPSIVAIAIERLIAGLEAQKKSRD